MKRSPDQSCAPASVDNPSSLDNAVVGAAVVINCAGPFALTAMPVLEAALRAVPYLDIAAAVDRERRGPWQAQDRATANDSAVAAQCWR